jgi:hypothetical protein
MVYTQICEWLDDFIGSDPPCELVDVWDLTEWIHESEVLDIFGEIVIPSFKNKKSRDDAENILHSLIWEYYLFRRGGHINKLGPDVSGFERIKAMIGSAQQSLEWHREKRDLLTASEFACTLDSRRPGMIREKVVPMLIDGNLPQTVFICREGKLNATAWGTRHEEAVRMIYEAVNSCSVLAGIPRLRHSKLTGLAASPDGIIQNGAFVGRLLEIKAPLSRILEDDIIPNDYYCQMQIQMEVCDIESADYCECRFNMVKNGAWSDISGVLPKFVGSLAVVGLRNNYKTWKYVYSPLFSNDEKGRVDAINWRPDLADSDSIEILELETWEIIDWQIITVARNRRWWEAVGLPEYTRFMEDVKNARVDPLYLLSNKIVDMGAPAPMFID